MYIKFQFRGSGFRGFHDFMTCSVHFIIKSEGSISQLWDTVRGLNLVYMFIRHSWIQSVNNFTLK